MVKQFSGMVNCIDGMAGIYVVYFADEELSATERKVILEHFRQRVSAEYEIDPGSWTVIERKFYIECGCAYRLLGIKGKVIGKAKSETVKLTIEAEMNRRWVPHFMSMLEYMEQLGNLGESRLVTFHADGDGDFRPKFNFSIDFERVPPSKEEDGDRIYDAG